MKVLVIGNGGREHALAWKLKQSRRVSEVIVAPGNAGTAHEHGVRNADVAVTDIEGLLKLAKAEKVELTVVGPEVPLVAGVVDKFRAAGLRIFGPRAIAAQLEGSKAFTKDFLRRHGIWSRSKNIALRGSEAMGIFHSISPRAAAALFVATGAQNRFTATVIACGPLRRWRRRCWR